MVLIPKLVTSPLKPLTANLAEAVVTPPTNRSLVILRGASAPFANCQKLMLPPGADQVGTPATKVKILPFAPVADWEISPVAVP